MKDFAQHGWKEVSLGEICEKTETVDPRKAPEDEFYYVDVSSVSNETFTIGETQRLLGADAPSRARRKIRSGDILFATIRPTLQRIAQVPEHLDGQVCSTGYIVLRPSPALDARFLMHSLFHPDFMGAMESLQSGASYPAVTDKQVRAQTIPLPPLEEQQRIVAVLDEAFEGLARARTHAEANLQNARELLANLINTIMDAAGADNVRQLGELCRFENGDRGKNYPGRKAFVPMGVPFINAGHLLNGPIDWASMNYIPEEHYNRLSNGKVKQGDLLFCLRGSLGKFGVVDADEAGAIASSLVIVRPSEKLLGDYLSAYFESKACADMIAEYAGGAAQPNLSAKSLAAFKIALPNLEQQQRVVRSISETRKSAEALINEYETKLQDLDDLRQSLLQKAFAGELA